MIRDLLPPLAVLGVVVAIWYWMAASCRSKECPQGMKPALTGGQCICVVLPTEAKP